MAAAHFLVIGSGYVAGPVLAHLARPGTTARVTLAGIDAAQLERLVAAEVAPTERDRVMLTLLNVRQDGDTQGGLLDKLVACADVVVSLVPADAHGPVARACVRARKHLVTASYVGAEMRALDEAARENGVALLNEMGLDPGIDTLSAVELVARLRGAGCSVSGFVSSCGALPAPDVARTNPLRYKFSWSPAGVLRACRNAARHLVDGAYVDVAGEALLAAAAPAATAVPQCALDALPNRDSQPYIAHVGLADERALTTFGRFTLRHRGFAPVMATLAALGLLSDEPLPAAFCAGGVGAPAWTWHDLVAALVGLPLVPRPDDAWVEAAVAERLEHGCSLDDVRALGVLDAETAIDASARTPAQALCALLERRLAYEAGERDMVVLEHRIRFRRPGAHEDETVTALLYEFGDARHSAVARTVGVPVALAAEMLARGEIAQRGVVVPSDVALARALLAALRGEGIALAETWSSGEPIV